MGLIFSRFLWHVLSVYGNKNQQQLSSASKKMSVISKVYTKADIQTLDTEGLRNAVPQILNAFNEDRTNLAVWGIYHEAALRLENMKPCLQISHAQYLQGLKDGPTLV